MRLLLAALVVAAAAGLALAAGIRAPARVLSVYDGDTLKVEAGIWPGLTWRGNVRVDGVDTPEIRGACDEEKRLARVARDFVRDLLLEETVTLVDVDFGKYGGRVAAHVLLPDGSRLDALLIETGHGRPYDGTTREGWCPPRSSGGD